VAPAVIAQVQHLVETGGADVALASEPARQIFLVLKKHHLAEVVSKAVGAVGIDPIFSVLRAGNVL
jgi:predicted aspartyl protease